MLHSPTLRTVGIVSLVGGLFALGAGIYLNRDSLKCKCPFASKKDDPEPEVQLVESETEETKQSDETQEQKE